MMCPNHVDQNKKHPNKKHPDSWLWLTKANNPNIVGLSSETIMLLPEPDVNKPLDCPLTQEGQLLAEQLVVALAQASHHLPQQTSAGYHTYIVPEENVPKSIDINRRALDKFTSTGGIGKQDTDTIMVAGIPYTRKDLPASVALSEI
jgi:hypothetical protein